MPLDRVNWSPPKHDYRGVKDYSYDCPFEEFYSIEYLSIIEWAFAEYITIDFSQGMMIPKMNPIKDFQDFPRWLFEAFSFILSLYKSIIDIDREAQSKS